VVKVQETSATVAEIAVQFQLDVVRLRQDALTRTATVLCTMRIAVLSLQLSALEKRGR
jgi:hypothetical protein